MRVMITGANGVIGKEIAHQLSKNKNYHLFLLSNSKINIRNKKKKIKLLYQDLTKPIDLKLKPNVVIHCAAKHPFSKTENGMKNIYSTNIKITKNLIKFCNENNVKKVIFLSAISVYGLSTNKVVFENQKPIKPNLYGKSKFLSEKLFCKKSNRFQTICLRIPGIFTLDLTKNHPLIIKILKRMINNEDIYAYNLNSKFNNIADTYEIVKFVNIVLKSKKIRTSIYNFSASKPIKFISAIHLIKKIFKSKSRIIQKKLNRNSFIISNKKITNDFNIKISATKDIITRCCRRILNTNYKVV